MHPGESVLVIGGGPIGLLYLLVFKGAGAHVIVSEPASQRASWARELGADDVIDPGACDVPERVKELTEGRGADVAVDTVGSQLVQAVRSVRKMGRVLVFGLNERASATLSPATLAYGEISIEGVYIAKGTFPLAIRMLTTNTLGFERLITRSYTLQDIGIAVDELRAGGVVKGMIIPNGL